MSGSRRSELAEKLRAPRDGASLAVVRIGLGLLIALEALNYLAGEEIARAFTDPSFHFTYQGFDWVQPWAGPGMYIHFAALVVLGLAVAAGVAHRITAPLLALGFAYVFLLDKAEYLNHFYAAILLLVLIAVTPADRAFSVAAHRNPERPQVVPTWAVWLLRFQVGVIYAYAGLAKLGDDWLAGEPMGIWLAERSDLPLVGSLLAQDPAGLLFSWSGAIYDLTIVPLLLWRRTRALAFGLVIAFNVSNWIIFDIGIFPPMMIVATSIFLDPDWPRKLGARLAAVARRLAPAAPSSSRPDAGEPVSEPAATAVPVPVPAAATAVPEPVPAPGAAAVGWGSRLLVPLLALYVAVQLLVPLRHHLYPGLVHWTEEGHRFSWHMKLRQKDGFAGFYAVDRQSGERRELDTADLITIRQLSRASSQPDMLLQLAHRLGERERALGHDVEVRVSAPVSLNGRPPQPMIDPDRDLSVIPRDLRTADWITADPGGAPNPG